jgi:hypothetical protein
MIFFLKGFLPLHDDDFFFFKGFLPLCESNCRELFPGSMMRLAHAGSCLLFFCRMS